MERLKSMKECFIAQIQGQLGNLSQVDAKELGEVVDMVKDLEEAIYYATVTKAMEGKEKEDGKHAERYYTPVYFRDMDRYNDGRMYYNPVGTGGQSSYTNYYDGNGGNHSGSTYNMSGSRYYTERDYPLELRDVREGRSPMSRKMYMESKEMHHDKAKQMQELEKYMKELTEDIVEMIDDASPEEKQVLQQKLTALASKVK